MKGPSHQRKPPSYEECWRLSVRTPARIRQPPAEDTLILGLSQGPARLELPLLDPQVARELGIVASFIKCFGVLESDEYLDGITAHTR